MIHKEVAVVGGGPAGLTASIELAKRDVEVTLIDENLQAGGQLLKQTHKFFGSEEHYAGIRGFNIAEKLIEEARDLTVDFLLEGSTYSVYEDKILAVKKEKSTRLISAEEVIFATGASEKVINFPGWTLPGVMGAGAVQTFVNQHKVLPGRKFTIVGSGNVGTIVAYQLLQAGAEVSAIVEAAQDIGSYYVHANKAIRSGDIPVFTSHTIKEAIGDKSVDSVTIAEVNDNWQPVPGTEKRIDTDVVCLAVGLEPRIKLTSLAGCRSIHSSTLGGKVPLHDKNMETSLEGVYVAGDVAGVEEASIAIEEGRLAGVSAASSLGYISSSSEADKKKEIRDRLGLLRGGRYGEERAKEKERIRGIFNEQV
jgi:thioredoxin reductase